MHSPEVLLLVCVRTILVTVNRVNPCHVPQSPMYDNDRVVEVSVWVAGLCVLLSLYCLPPCDIGAIKCYSAPTRVGFLAPKLHLLVCSFSLQACVMVVVSVPYYQWHPMFFNLQSWCPRGLSVCNFSFRQPQTDIVVPYMSGPLATSHLFNILAKGLATTSVT